MAIIWLLLGAALVVVGSVFYAQNPQSVDLYLWGYTLPAVPLWLVAAAPLVAGLILGLLLGLPARLRTALANRRLMNQLQDRERTIGQLQQRVAELERDLAIARRPVPPAVGREERELPEVPDGTRAQPEAHAA
jgi:uncharacterized integral membrane protein